MFLSGAPTTVKQRSAGARHLDDWKSSPLAGGSQKRPDKPRGPCILAAAGLFHRPDDRTGHSGGHAGFDACMHWRHASSFADSGWVESAKFLLPETLAIDHVRSEEHTSELQSRGH